jgi:hypothetical protein
MIIKPPVLPSATQEYSKGFIESLLRNLNHFFRGLATPLDLNIATMHVDTKSLPTEASLASLRSGDIYRDTTADNVLKVKP